MSVKPPINFEKSITSKNRDTFILLIYPNTAWKVSKYEVISGPYFPVFGLNTERYGVSLCIQSEYKKIRTRNNSAFEHLLCIESDKDNRLRLMATLENMLIKYQLQMMYLLISDVILTVGNGSNTKYDIDRAIGNCQEDCLSTFLFIHFTFILKMLP